MVTDNRNYPSRCFGWASAQSEWFPVIPPDSRMRSEEPPEAAASRSDTSARVLRGTRGFGEKQAA
jgi:hypothetical protein